MASASVAFLGDRGHVAATVLAVARRALQGERVGRRGAVERGDRGQRLQLVLLELVVERARVLADEPRDRLVDVAELPAQRLDPVELVPGGPALPQIRRGAEL